MPNDDRNKLYNASINQAHVPLDVVLTLLRQQVKDNISPIGLELDCAALKTWSQVEGLDRFRHKYLIQELKAWNPLICHRPITRICIKEPFELVDAPNFTELVYAIGHNLKVMVGSNVEHAVTLTIADLTNENIALVKGLNFNHIRLRLSLPTDIEALKQTKKRVNDFKIPFLSLVLEQNVCEEGCQLQLMELLSFIQPDTIQIQAGVVQNLHSSPNHLNSMLMQFGYYFHQGRYIVKFRSPLANIPHDQLRLGPGARSQIGQLCAINFVEPDNYLQAVRKQLLPVSSCR